MGHLTVIRKGTEILDNNVNITLYIISTNLKFPYVVFLNRFYIHNSNMYMAGANSNVQTDRQTFLNDASQFSKQLGVTDVTCKTSASL